MIGVVMSVVKRVQKLFVLLRVKGVKSYLSSCEFAVVGSE